MTTTHTPGPWKVRTDPLDDHGPPLISAEGQARPELVARLAGLDPRADDANARLIAAAPDLLAAAERVLASAAVAGVCRCETCAALRAAIAKARGGA